MKIHIFAEELKNAIKKAEKIINKKLKVDILQNIKITAYNNKIHVIADNLESRLIIDLDGSIEEEGEILIYNDNFKLINKIKSQLEISDNSNTVTIEGNRTLNFVQSDPAMFPEFKKQCNKKAFTIKAYELKEMLKIKVATLQDDTRPQLNGICIRDNKVYSCDGFRLIRYQLDIHNQCNSDIIIPLNSVNQLDKIIDKKDCQILEVNYYAELEPNNSEQIKYLSITSKDWTFITKLIPCEYFKVEQVIPNEVKYKITIDSKTFKESLEFASELGKKDNKNPIVFTITENKLNIKMSTEKQSMSEDINIYSNMLPDERLKIGFNIKYVLDAIKTLNVEDELLIQFKGRNIDPMLISSKDDKEMHLILPVKLSDNTESAA
jgi:DNA polymerase-3 subunit beta